MPARFTNILRNTMGTENHGRIVWYIIKLFDNDQRKIGSNHKGIIISDIRNMKQEVTEAGIEMAIIAVPATVAQRIVDDLVATGIRAFLNFAPINLEIPPDVYLRNENMAMELEYLSFAMLHKHKEKKPRS